MMLLAKAALGLGGALVAVGAYTFHEGVIRMDVDEFRAGGSHIHLWVPAAMVPMTMYFVPKHHLCDAASQAREFLPVAHAFFKELRKFPDVELMEVKDDDQHVRIRTRGGKLQIDVDDPGEKVHLLVPLSTVDEVIGQIEDSAPDA